MKSLKLIYLVLVFSLPVWKLPKYRFLDDMPKWMQTAIRVRNEYRRVNGLLDVFYLAKVGRLYVRDPHSYPMGSVWKHSRKHLFAWKYADA